MPHSDSKFWQEKPPENRVINEDIVTPPPLDLDFEEIESRLTKARTQLILDKPFLGNLVLRLPLVAAKNWCKTTATDAKNFYYSPDFIDKLDSHQIKFVLIHEALHCALTHFARRGSRVKHRWDLACDFAINPLLVKEGFHPPLEVPIFRQYEGMIAEEIYPMIDDKSDAEPMDQHLYDDENDDENDNDGGLSEADLQKKDEPTDGKKTQKSTPKLAEKPSPLSADEVEKLATEWQKNLASSAQLAFEAGKLTGEFAKLIDFFLQPKISWRALLAQYMSSFARDDFSYQRPSRRTDEALLPALKSEQIDINIAIDTSGSISQIEVDEFVAEINAIKGNIRAAINLIACDDHINPASPWRFEAWDEMIFPTSLGGGGGTNFTPVFDHIKANDTHANLLIYFTDAKGKFPEYPPNYPVLWLIKGKESVPWGVRIQLN